MQTVTTLSALPAAWIVLAVALGCCAIAVLVAGLLILAGVDRRMP